MSKIPSLAALEVAKYMRIVKYLSLSLSVSISISLDRDAEEYSETKMDLVTFSLFHLSQFYIQSALLYFLICKFQILYPNLVLMYKTFPE